jgi:orotate phosphoribosyltransferase
MTTGLSTRETMKCIEEAGGNVVAAGALIDRSGGAVDLGVPRAALLTLSIQNYNPAACPLCKAGMAAVKPGSRTKAGVEKSRSREVESAVKESRSPEVEKFSTS